MAASRPAIAYPLLWSDNVAAVSRWAQQVLGFAEQWAAPGPDGQLEHVELTGFGNSISINVRNDTNKLTGPAGIALPVASNAAVDALHRQALDAGAEIIQGPEHSPVAYSFTARDPDGNQWWVHAETGMLDTLRRQDEPANA